jgi:hypothetical protein
MADEVGTAAMFPADRLTFGLDRECWRCKGRGLAVVVDAVTIRPAGPKEIILAQRGKGPARACRHCSGTGITA